MNIEKNDGGRRGEGTARAVLDIRAQDFFEFLPVKVSQIEVYLDGGGKISKFYATGFILS